jgi:hypothetical protein
VADEKQFRPPLPCSPFFRSFVGLGSSITHREKARRFDLAGGREGLLELALGHQHIANPAAVVEALRFKCDVLWLVLDALTIASPIN